MRLSVIVVAFGKEELLEACLSRIDDALDRVEGETQLIVVVNDASASMREQLRARSPAVVTVAGAPELGFAGGVDAGLKIALGEWVALVNDDCLLDADALAELLAVGEQDQNVGSVAAQIRLAVRPERLNSEGIELDELGIARERKLGQRATVGKAQSVDVFGASATLGLYRRAMLDSVGGVDASFFAYLEDADLAWRAQMAGWRCLLAPRAIAFHHHSATLGHGSAAKHVLVGRNRVRMLAKNATARQLRRSVVQIAIYDLLYVGYVAVAGRTLAPLVGRLQGLREWKTYRVAGGPGRREIPLSRSPGVRHALRRSRVYHSLPSSTGRRRCVEVGIPVSRGRAR